jgi:serine/threonine protein kinase/Tol biopolymer transport system component
MTLDKQRWRQVETLYHAALEHESGAREAYLAQACAGDEELRREVEELLRYDGTKGSFMQDNALAVAAQALEPNELSQTAPQLFPGQSIGAYKILALLGRGGMGVVYRARDERLRRDVAIKVLPASFAHDADRLRRFEQEAHATSALNHPNILTIYDIGAHDGAPFIVAELLEGEELRAQLESGALPARKALEYAQQITQGLAAAHEKGIVHRDLKPENLFVTKDGRVKILDFGLAKLHPPQPGVVDTGAPTQKRLTHPGVVMGTVGYMSPEQVRGQEADHRADIFSFGIILYEMLSGKRAFNGASVADVMSAILKEEPPELGETNAKISPALEKIMRRCLEKKPERRFQTASDLTFALEALTTHSNSRQETPAVETVSATPHLGAREKWWMGATAVAILLAVGFAWAYLTRQPAADAPEMKFSILPPEKSSIIQIALSPDGRHLAFTAATGGKVQLWVRARNASEARPLAGTQGAYFPFWSPDSRFIAFFANGQLNKINVTGGPVQPLRQVVGLINGGAWSRNGVILFGQTPVGLLRISETSGEVTQVTTLDKTRQEINHRYPTFLPDGRHFLYSITSGQKETRGVYLGSLDDRTVKRRLLDQVTPVKYMAAVPGDTAGGAGWLVFVRDGALLAWPFDTSRLEFTGEPFTLSNQVGSDLLNANYFTFSVSDNGVLVFDPSLERHRRRYCLVDRRGQQINSLYVDAGPTGPWLSPDDKQFIADRYDPRTGSSDLWLCDVSGGAGERFTIDPASDFSPAWEPNGNRIVWASNRDTVTNLYQKAASGAGDETRLLKSEYPNIPTDWSQDGQFIIYRQIDPKTIEDVWFLPQPGSGKPPFPVVQTEHYETSGTLSPDGKWLAYASDESGLLEVYVQSYPGPGGKRPVSNGGAHYPRWRRDGRELFYYSGDGKLMARPVRIGESFEMDAPISLFEFRAGTIPGSAPYAVTADGQRFLINTVVETEPNAPLTVVVNWAAGVKK